MCRKFYGDEKIKIAEDAILYWGKYLSNTISKRDFLKSCFWIKEEKIVLEFRCKNRGKKWKLCLGKDHRINILKILDFVKDMRLTNGKRLLKLIS